MHRSASGLTWHDNTIPTQHIWVKLGGDKGRGSFKMNMQVVNVTRPNSIHNTCLLAVFEANDSPANLHTALDQYREHVEEMEGMMYRYVQYM